MNSQNSTLETCSSALALCESVEKEEPPPKWFFHLIAGAISGPTSRTLTAPVDRIRLSIQVDAQKKTMLVVIQDLLAEGGVRGLWRGNLINVMKVCPEMAVRFGLYEKVKTLVNVGDHPFTLSEKFVSGSIAGVVGQWCIYPMEVLKTRMTIRTTGQFSGIFDAIRKIYITQGLSGFYRGYKASAIGIVPYTGIDLATFDTLRKRFVYVDSKDINKFEAMLRVMTCALIATTSGQCVSYPFYLIKARQQAGSSGVPVDRTNFFYDRTRFRFQQSAKISD